MDGRGRSDLVHADGEFIDDRGAALVISHGGAVSGGVALNTAIPATRSPVVLLSTSDFSPLGALSQELVAKLMPKSPDVPAVAGLSALDAATKFLTDLQKGAVDRSTPSADFNDFLSGEKLHKGQTALNALRKIANVRVAGLRERGGMEVAIVMFDVGKTPTRGVMYRTPDGKIQEFLFARN